MSAENACRACGGVVQWHPQSDDFGVCSACGKDQFPEPGDAITTLSVPGAGRWAYAWSVLVLITTVLLIVAFLMLVFGIPSGGADHAG